ncbi:MAG TPA: DUF885 family protein, partial [Steroidobacteraceae bacterium]|nr:DUF885 family protein [Steroidobacteraceae bacterium]
MSIAEQRRYAHTYSQQAIFDVVEESVGGDSVISSQGTKMNHREFLMRRFARLTAFALVSIFAACGQTEKTATLSADEQFEKLEHEYVVYFFSRFPVVATYLGGAAFDNTLANIDGKLRDHSAEALQAEDTKLQDFRQRFSALDEAKLSARRRIDRTVAMAQIDFLLRQHGSRRYQERALDTYVDEPFRGVDWQIQGMTATGENTYGNESEWRALTKRVSSIPAYLAVAEKQIAAGAGSGNTPDWRVLMQFGLKSTLADAEYFATTLPAIAAQDISGPSRESLLSDVKSGGENASQAYRHLRDFIAATFFDDVKKSDVTALKPAFRADRFAFGDVEYNWAVHNNLRLDKTAAQLFEESWPIVEISRKSMVDLAAEIATKHHWKSASDKSDVVRVVFDKLSEDAPKSDDEMIELYRSTGARLVEYARKTGLFEVPAEYKLDVTITPPPLRSGIDGAAYYPAPPFKKTGVGRFYVTPTGNDLAQLRQDHNHAALADLAAHEGFPGHDWHYKVMSRYAEEISPVRWLTPGAVEDSSS